MREWFGHHSPLRERDERPGEGQICVCMCMWPLSVCVSVNAKGPLETPIPTSQSFTWCIIMNRMNTLPCNLSEYDWSALVKYLSGEDISTPTHWQRTLVVGALQGCEFIELRLHLIHSFWHFAVLLKTHFSFCQEWEQLNYGCCPGQFTSHIDIFEPLLQQ